MKLTPLFCLLALAAAACSSQTSVAISVAAPDRVLSELHVTVQVDGSMQTTTLRSGFDRPVVVLLPDVATQVVATVAATDSLGHSISGSGATASVPHHRVDLVVTLAPPANATADFGAPVDMPLPPPADQAPPDLAPSPDLSPTPSLTLLAGAPGGGGEADGKGASARFTSPQAVAFIGNLAYVTDLYSYQLRNVTADGTVTTVVLHDAAGETQLLQWPAGIAYDGSQYLYVAEQSGCALQRIDPSHDNVLARVAGSGDGVCGFADGDTDSSQLSKPRGVAIDGNGLVWITDQANCAVRTYSPTTNLLSTVAGVAGSCAITDGSGASAGASGSARFVSPEGIAVIAGKIYITDGKAIRVIDPTLPASAAGFVTSAVHDNSDFDGLEGIGPGDQGSLLVLDDEKVQRVFVGAPPSYSVVVGHDGYSEPSDGDGAAASLQSPGFMAFDAHGLAWFTDGATVRTLQVGGTWTVKTVAGAFNLAGDSSSPSRLDSPAGLAWDGQDYLYLADYEGQLIRRYQLSTGQLIVLAGNGTDAHIDDNGTAAAFGGPRGLALDGKGHLFVADYDTHFIRKITLGALNTVETVAGVAGGGALPKLQNPQGLAFDGAQTLYIADVSNHAIRTLDTLSGQLGVLAGTGAAGYLEGPGASALLGGPRGLALDSARNLLYFTDGDNHVVRKVDLGAADKTVALVSGSNSIGATIDNVALTAAGYVVPDGIVFDAASNVLYVSDFDDERVRRLDLGGNFVTTYVGDGSQRTRPGPLPANIHGPEGLALLPTGLAVTSLSENALLLAK